MRKEHGRQEPEVSFNEYLPLLWEVARRRGLEKQEFLRKAGFTKNRFADWTSGALNLTARSFVKLAGGLRMTLDDVITLCGKRFTKEQKRELQRQFFLRDNPDIVDLLLNDPDLVKTIRTRDIPNTA